MGGASDRAKEVDELIASLTEGQMLVAYDRARREFDISRDRLTARERDQHPEFNLLLEEELHALAVENVLRSLMDEDRVVVDHVDSDGVRVVKLAA